MPAETHCDYCHLPVPAARRRGGHASPTGPLYCCYGCSLAARITQARGEQGQATWMLTRLGVAGFLSMGVMVFSMYLYGQAIYDAGPSPPSPLSVSLTGLMRYASLAFATPVFFILGLPILSNAIGQWRHGIVSTDALVVLGVAAAFIYSYVSTLTDGPATYYETACMILVLVTLGRWLEATGKLRASAAVEALEALMPSEVSVRRGAETITVRADDIQADDRLLVPAGQRIAADGVIESGQAHIDEQLVTGESTPIVRKPGEPIRAGTVNVDGALTIRVTAVGTQTTLGRLIRLLEAAKRSKGRYERLADRMAAVFIPVIVILAAVAAAAGCGRGGADEAIMSALAVLLIACPCALGIATPMAIWVALGHAATFGVLFRHGETVEALARVKAICFDKTGTLTSGRPTVSTFATWANNGSDEHQVLAVAAGLGAVSAHAVSRSLTKFARSRGVTPAVVSEVRTVPGRGLVGVSADGEASLGSLDMMSERKFRLDGPLAQAALDMLSDGQGIVCVGWDRVVRGVFGFSETLRAEARQALDRLKTIGFEVLVLTGDHKQRGRAIAEALAVRTLAGLSPEDKVRRVAQARGEHGPVAMVGDGLNDAPALAEADVGIALGCGADVTRESADVCLLGDDLMTLPWLLSFARRTVRTIKVNLFWAFVYNAIGISLAITGRLSPIFAAAAMVVSSLLVVANSLRLGRTGPETAS